MDCSSTKNCTVEEIIWYVLGVYCILPVFFISELNFLFLMLASFISPQGLDRRNKYVGDNSLERRHLYIIERKQKEGLVRFYILLLGGQLCFSQGNLTHLSCWLLRNCCYKRLIQSWTSCRLVGNMEKEESHRTAHLVLGRSHDSAQAKMTWNLCIDTSLPIHLHLTECCIIARLQSRGGMFWFHHRFSIHFIFGISL